MRPRAAYGVAPPVLVPIAAATDALMGAVFSATAAGIVGTVAGVGTGYFLAYAAAHPDEAEDFRQYVLDNVMSPSGLVGDSYSDLVLPTASLPSTVKDSIVSFGASQAVFDSYTPVLPSGFVLPEGYYLGWNLVSFYNNLSVNNFDSISNNALTGMGIIYYSLSGSGINRTYKANIRAFSDTLSFVEFTSGQSGAKITLQNLHDHDVSITNDAGSVLYVVRPGVTWSMNKTRDADTYVSGVDFGSGYESVSFVTGAPATVTGAFGDLLAGDGTVADVVSAGNASVGAIRLPGVTVDVNGDVTTVPTDITSGATYANLVYSPAEWAQIEGGGTVDPPAPGGTLDDVLSILTTVSGTLLGIPPFLADIPGILDAIIDIPDNLMDLLTAPGGLPGVLRDYLDDWIIDVPPVLEDLLDGAIIDLPTDIGVAVGAVLNPQLGQIAQGLVGQVVPGIAGITSGVAGVRTAVDALGDVVTDIPATIADALGLDWALDGLADLADRIDLDMSVPDGVVLPQATWSDLVGVAQDFGDMTPVGLLVTVVTVTTDVMSGNDGSSGGGGGGGGSRALRSLSSGAPRYEIRFPYPVEYVFVVDFATFGELFPAVTHGVFYMLFVYWYLKFVKACRNWYATWFGFLSEAARTTSEISGGVFD